MSFINLTTQNFEKYVLHNDQIVVVEFYAEWSGVSHILLPALRGIKSKFRKQVMFGRLDIDKENDIAEKYGVFELPTILIFRDSHVIDSLHGIFAHSLIEDKLNRLINADEL
ncbi:hypothetical protein JW960_04585 [candidate division KSB1 bacterium]|nr:hypothetical protein [candidate division KSB1 bacterium]